MGYEALDKNDLFLYLYSSIQREQKVCSFWPNQSWFCYEKCTITWSCTIQTWTYCSGILPMNIELMKNALLHLLFRHSSTDVQCHGASHGGRSLPPPRTVQQHNAKPFDAAALPSFATPTFIVRFWRFTFFSLCFVCFLVRVLNECRSNFFSMSPCQFLKYCWPVCLLITINLYASFSSPHQYAFLEFLCMF